MLKYVLFALILDFAVNFQLILLLFSAFQRFWWALHRSRKKFEIWWRWRWKNEDETFQLFIIYIFIIKSDIDRFPNHCTLQICKWFPTKIIIFEEQASFLLLIDTKKRGFRRFLKSIRCRKLACSSKIIILVGNHLHICNVQGLGNPPVPHLTI